MIGESAGKSFAYILGVYLGDGCVYLNRGRSIFVLSTIDTDFAEMAKAALRDISTYSVWSASYRDKRSPNKFYRVQVGDKSLCEKLKSDTHNKTIIPDYVFNLFDRGEKLAFISGVMDSEGFVAANKSNPTNRKYYMGYKSCDVWVPSFIRLLESVGLKIGKVSQEIPLKPGYKVPTRFHIKMQSWVDSGCYFNIARKQRRVEAWNESGAYERRSRNPRRLTPEAIRQTV